jgi:hypothetical protein
MASGHGLRLRAGPVSADDACRARAAFSRVRVGATQRRVYELLRREQDALGNTDPTEAELQ